MKPDIACSFFRDNLDKALCHRESYLVVEHALEWSRLMRPMQVEVVAELELLSWQYRIEADLVGTSLLVDLQSEAPPPRPLLAANIPDCTSLYPNTETDYSDAFLQKVTEWIDRSLDCQDLVVAIKLSAMFRRKSSDLMLLLLVMDVVESVIDLADAGERLAQIFPLKSVEVEWKDRISFIDYANELLQHGHDLCLRILVCYQVSLALDLKYDYVMEHPRPVYVLKMLLETPGQSTGLSLAIGGHLNLARSWIATCRIPASEVVALVKDELIEVARTAHSRVNDAEANMVVSFLVASFNRFVTLCADPTQLGRAILEAALDRRADNEWPIAVELLIFAHSSFTLACDVENIGTILTHARSFVDNLLVEEQWLLITRLTTGIQR